MAKCSICGKGPRTGNNVSHANNKTKRRWLPNIQKIRVDWEGQPRMMNVCTRCLSATKVVKVARGRHAASMQSV